MAKQKERSLQCTSCNEIFSANELYTYKQEHIAGSECPCCGSEKGFRLVIDTYDYKSINQNIKQYIGKITNRSVMMK